MNIRPYRFCGIGGGFHLSFFASNRYILWKTGGGGALPKKYRKNRAVIISRKKLGYVITVTYEK
jgi:hypothetical protein